MSSSRNVRTSTRSRRRWQNELRAERRIDRGFGIRKTEVPDVLKGLVKEPKNGRKGHSE